MIRPHRTSAMILALVSLFAACRDRRDTGSPPPPSSATHTPAAESAPRIDTLATLRIAVAYSDGVEAYGRGKFAEAAESFQRALDVNPGDETTLYLVASARAKGGEIGPAVDSLRRLADLRSDFIPRADTFALIADSAEYRKVVRDLEANARQIHRGRVAFTLSGKDLNPEGIAYDPVGKTFYIGSVTRGMIVAARPESEGAPARVSEFIRERQDGLYSVLGMKVDPARRALWVASSALPELDGIKPGEEGRAGVFQFNLGTGKLIRKYLLENRPNHLLNDLVLAPSGDLYVTDSLQGAVYKLRAGRDALELFIPAKTFHAPNGIAASEDGRIFVGSWDQGISIVDPVTRDVARLTQPAGFALNGPDGLTYLAGSLIAIQGGVGPGRVSRFFLNQSRKGVERVEILDSNHPLYNIPTTGTLAEGAFHYIANSRSGSIRPDGSPDPAGPPRDVVILRIDLE